MRAIAKIDIEAAGGLLAVLRNGHRDPTVEVDARREAANEIERLRVALNDIVLLDDKWMSGRQRYSHAFELAKRALEQTPQKE